MTPQEIGASEEAHHSIKSVGALPDGRRVLRKAEVRPQAIDDDIAFSEVPRFLVVAGVDRVGEQRGCRMTSIAANRVAMLWRPRKRNVATKPPTQGSQKRQGGVRCLAIRSAPTSRGAFPTFF